MKKLLNLKTPDARRVVLDELRKLSEKEYGGNLVVYKLFRDNIDGGWFVWLRERKMVREQQVHVQRMRSATDESYRKLTEKLKQFFPEVELVDDKQ